MSNLFKLKTLLMLLAIGVFLASCASAPVKELNDAEKSIQAAERVNANKYAPEELKGAKNFYNTAEGQSGKKEYDKAKENAIKAKDEGDKAYYKAINEFVKSQNEGTKKSMEEAKVSHADVAVPDMYKQAEDLYNEVQIDINKLNVLQEKLKAQKSVKE